MGTARIQSAIALGSVKTDAGDTEVVYEGNGPAGVGFIVECLTENRRRTAPLMRSIFAKYGGKLAEPGTVQWKFNKVGIVVLEKFVGPIPGGSWAEFILDLVDSLSINDLDCSNEEDGMAELVCDWKKLIQVRTDLEKSLSLAQNEEKAARIISAATVWRPLIKTEVARFEDRERLMKLQSALEDCDDVQVVHHSWEGDHS